MFNFFKNLKLSIKVSLLGIGSAFITASVLVWIAVLQSGEYNEVAKTEIDELINTDLNNISMGVYNLVATENEAVQEHVNINLNVAKSILDNSGELSFSDYMISWTAINQYTETITKINLPQIVIGGTKLIKNDDFSSVTPVIDKITNLIGGTVTIFQRMNEKGDMLRVATTVPTSEGKRAIGTFIPAINPDSTQNNVISQILKGNIYHGRVFVVNAWYLTAYQPIMDENGYITGMFYVGVKQASAEARVRQAILNTKVGESGYVFVLHGKGKDKGKYIISEHGERDGESLWNTTYLKGQYVARNIIYKALTLGPGEFDTERYLWKNPDDEKPRWKIARIAYYEPWDWVIGVSTYEDELQKYYEILSTGRSNMTFIMIMAGLGIALLIGTLSIFLTLTLIRPINKMTDVVNKIIGGNFDEEIRINSSDEIGTLANSFNEMTRQLKSTLEGLRVSESKYRAIFDQTFQLTGLLKPTGEVLEANKTALAYIQQDESEIIGKLFWETPWWSYSEEQRLKLLANLKKAAKGEFVRFETIHMDKKGRIRYFDFSIKPMMDENGKVTILIPEARDITDNKLNEVKLIEAKEKAELSDRLKSEFLAQISHEIRTPINTIFNFTELIKELQDFKKFPETKEYFDVISKSGDRIIRTIDMLLNMSELQTGSYDCTYKQVELYPNILEKIQAEFAYKAQSKGLELILDKPESNIKVFGDQYSIEQIIVNLIDNAIKYTKEGRINITPHINEKNITSIVIRDTGIGIGEEYLPKIFQAFSQEEQGYTRKYEGSGLGMALVKKYCELNNIQISIESKKNVGTTFIISFEDQDKLI